MALTTIARVKVALGITTTAEDALLTQLLAQAEQMVRDHLGISVEQQTITAEYLDGTGTMELGLRETPVQSVSDVRVDLLGQYGQRAGSFDSTTALTAGVDYALVMDGTGPFAGYSRSGLLLRLARPWPGRRVWRSGLLAAQAEDTRGSIRCSYVAGFATVPEPIKLAAETITARLRNTLAIGKGATVSSQSFDGASKTLVVPPGDARQWVTPDVAAMLGAYRRARV